MNKRKILRLFLILFVIGISVYYLFKDNTDYSTKPLPTSGIQLYKKIYWVYLGFLNSFDTEDQQDVHIIRTAKNDKEKELISRAEKIKCVSDNDCLDLSNIDKLADEVMLFNRENNNFRHLYNKKTIYYYIGVRSINELGENELQYYDKLDYYDVQKQPIKFSTCLDKIGMGGYLVNQSLTKCEGRYYPRGCNAGTKVKILFFLSNNDYACGSQEYIPPGV